MQQDFVALQWVGADIGQTADALGKELLGFADNLSDPTRLRHALTLAHQMHATLRLLAIESAEQFAREIEEVVQAMLHGRVQPSEANLQLLLAATLQLPGYLRRMANERRELPFDLHSTLNDLRRARGEPDLPAPVVDRSIDVSELALGAGDEAESATDDDLQLLRKARQRLQAELLGLLRGEPPRDRLHAMGRVFGLLAQRLRPGGQRHFWQACHAVCDAVIGGGVTCDEKIRNALRDIDNELRAAIALELRFYTRAPSEALYRQLLDIIAASRPATSTLVEIQQRHRLIPDRPGDAPTALVDLGATDAAVGMIAADLARVLEQFETIEGDALNVGRLLHSVEPDLRRVCLLLAGLGYRDEHELLLPQIERIAAGLVGSGSELEDRLTEITAALLEVDQRLAARLLRAGGQDTAQAEARQHPLARALAAVCREVQAGIEQTKQAITDYSNSERELQLLTGSGDRLHALGGALRLAGLGAAGYVLEDCHTYLRAVLDGRCAPPAALEIDAFADALSSVEYFLERLLIDRVPAELILVHAREAMRSLALGEALAARPEPVPAIAEAESTELPEAAVEAVLALPAEEPAFEIANAPAQEQPAPGPAPESAAEELVAELVAEGVPEEVVLELAPEAPTDEPVPEPEPAAEYAVEELLAELAPPEALQVEPVAELASADAPMEFDLSSLAEEQEIAFEFEPEPEPEPEPEVVMDFEPVAELPAVTLEPVLEAVVPPATLEPETEAAEPPDPEIVEIFVEEAAEVLQTLAAQFPLWRATPTIGNAATELRRAYHTLKGSGRMVGAEVIGELAWSIENLLNRVTERSVVANAEVLSAVEQANAMLPGLVDAFAQNRAIDREPVLRLQEIARALADGLPAPWDEPAQPEPAVEAAPPVSAEATELPPIEADELPSLQADELPPIEPAELPSIEAVDVELDGAELQPLEALETFLDAGELQAQDTPFELEPIVEAPPAPEPAVPEFSERAAEIVFELEQPAPAAEAPPPAPAEPALEDLDAPDPEIVEIFVEEAAEVLQTIAAQFPLWRATPTPGTPLTELRRAFHTLKGSGRMVGANVIGELAWSIENLLNRVIDRSVSANADVLQAVERAQDMLPGLVSAYAARTRVDLAPVQRLQDATTALARGLPVRWEEAAAAVPAPEPEAQPEALALDPGIASEAELPSEDWLPELEPAELEAAAQPLAGAPEELDAEARLLQIFADEAAAHLRTIRAALAGAASGDELRRSLHTLRGSAFAAGVSALGGALVPLDELATRAGAGFAAVEARLLEELSALLDALIVADMQVDEAAAGRCAALRDAAAQRLAERAEPAAAPSAPVAEARMSRFLEEALETLFHCGTLLDSWRAEGHDSASRTALVTALAGIQRKAEQLEVAAVQELAHALVAALGGGAAEAPEVFDTVKQALDSCLDALDRIAAGQPAQVPVALLAALQELAAAPASARPAPVPAALDETLRVRVARDLQQAEHELLDVFLEEAGELMASIDEDIDAWRHNRSDRAVFENIQRALHTLKGGARMAGLRYLGELSHNFETFLINQGVQFGHFDDAFFARVGDFHEQLASTVDLVRERPVLPAIAAPVPEPPVAELEPQAEAVPDAVEPALEAAPPAPVQEAAPPEPAAEAPPPAHVEPAVVAAAPDTLRQRVARDLQGAEAELLGIFLEEAEELMASIDAGIDAWRGDRANRAPYDRLQRDLHTLKGGARMAGISTLGDLAHDFETMLIGEGERPEARDDAFFARVGNFHEQLARVMDVVRERPSVDAAPTEVAAAPVPVPIDAAPAAVEPAPAPVAEAETLAPEPLPATPEPVAAALEPDTSAREPMAVAPEPVAEAAVEPMVPVVPVVAPEPTPAPRAVPEPVARVEIPLPVLPARVAAPPGTIAVVAARTPVAAPAQAAAPRQRDDVVRVSAQLLEDLVNLAGETSISRGRVEEQVSELGKLFEDMQGTIERMQGQVRRLDIATEAQILFRRERAESAGTEGFDPLEMDRYSQLQQLSRSLVESASDVLDIKRTLAEKTRDLETVLIQQSRINSQLQEGLMRSRMVPFASILPRIKRVVRQVAQELDKSVDLELGNMAGELDRGILERVVAPLEHMLRNAVDHGIESKDKRKAAGKPATGRIVIEIARDGGDVLIAISDDGGGVNLAAVRAKAIERGLMEADSDLGDHEVVQFILHSGFSTAAKVTQISGRGVGMDVVSSEIRQMGGSLEIFSTQGQGSRFTIRLPFTVSVSRALLVTAGAEIFALPLNTVEGVVRMSTDELARHGGESGELFHYAGQSYAVAYLGSLLYPGEQRGERRGDKAPVVLVRGGGVALAIEVERLIGANEIVVKSLGPQFGAVPGLSGATVLGDGSVVLILDVPAMLRDDAQRGAQAGADSRRAAARTAQAVRAPLIMVCDDSVTVRKVTTRFLEREGMRVMTAKDGADAMAQLQEHVPDLMLLDIEMPHMDGFEVVSKVRLSETLRHLPIIMITSRTGEKHRERALSLGADMYLGKPYQESVLIEHINALLKREPA